MTESHPFEHEKLDAYHVCDAFIGKLAAVLRALPRGEGPLADQLRRAGDSVFQNLCEGAGRFSPRDKARFYDMAIASGTECAASLQIALRRELVAADTVADARKLLHRAVSMLVGLARSARARER